MQTRETVIRIVMIALLAYSLLSFAAVRRETAAAEEKAALLSERLAVLETENERLAAAAENAGSDVEIQRLARERLGLVMPGETVFYFNTGEDR